MYRRELYTFLAVAEEGSFLKASKKCFLTPASVMHQIDNLEAALGVRLFRRTNQGVVLTPAGQSFYRDAQALLREGEQAVRRARDLDRAERSTIRVGTSILRPGRALVDLWSSLGDAPFKLELVPFDEAAGGTDAMLSALGGQLDCFVSPSASPAGSGRITSSPCTGSAPASPCPGPIPWPKRPAWTGRTWTERPCFWFRRGSPQSWTACGRSCCGPTPGYTSSTSRPSVIWTPSTSATAWAA